MSAGRICNRSVVTVSPTETVREAARRMAEHRVGTLVAIGEGGRPTGIVTDRDIVVRMVAPAGDLDATLVSKVLTTPIRTVLETTPIEVALATMAEAGIRRIVVTDRAGVLVGILALDDVLELLIEEAETIGRLIGERSVGAR